SLPDGPSQSRLAPFTAGVLPCPASPDRRGVAFSFRCPMRRIITVAVVSLLLVSCGGHSRTGAVSGKLTYKGQPLNGAALFLHPAGGGEAFLIPVTQEGTFQT